ncbi:murein hydrolase activator EnvC family protein [Thermithiobacillus plumbiphilus]|uniref:Peptidoglycan DD-metalloendopeptidase family protein n=1 Tax=Thermithiobacillus plumbiphilus TaxID=1729899 RepID=A0ABU9D9K4_9PROT
MKKWQRLVLVCLIGFAGLITGLPPQAQARTAQETQQHKLKKLHKEIGDLRQTVKKTRRSKAEIEADLRRLDQEIRTQGEKLQQLQTRQAVLQQGLQQLQGQSRDLAQSLAQQRKLLSKQLRAAYMQGPQSLLQLWLNQKNPAEPSRGMEYFRRLNQARLDQIDSIRNTSQAVASKSTELARAQASLQENTRQIATQQTALEEGRQARQKLALEVQKTLAGQEKRLTRLQKDARNLDHLLKRLAAQAAKRAKIEATRRARIKAQEQARLRAEAAKKHQTSTQARSESRRPAKTAVALAQLSPPVGGPILVRFGSPRMNGGMRWQGVVFGSSAGSPVRAIAPGRVVYAGSLRGYGQIMILDHDNGLLSLYSHIRGMLRETGQRVAAGEQIASVGQDPDQEESGLYFELRKNGRPVNPQSYLRSR